MQDAGLLPSQARPDVAEAAGQHLVHAAGQVLLAAARQQPDAGGGEGGDPLGVVLEHAAALGQSQQDEFDASQRGFVQGVQRWDRQLAFVPQVVAVRADREPGGVQVVGESRVVDHEGGGLQRGADGRGLRLEIPDRVRDDGEGVGALAARLRQGEASFVQQQAGDRVEGHWSWPRARRSAISWAWKSSSMRYLAR